MKPLGRRPWGNILITALFMAIFLFFLSVAMISQNRMDLSLGLAVDHRLKADSAARAGLNWALRTMRTQPNWPDLLKGPKPELESGAVFEVEVRSRSNDSGDPYLLLITAKGTSGLVAVDHWAVVEEVRKTPDDADHGTQLFARAWNQADPPKPDNLAMLGSDFQWYDLGPLPTGDTTLESSGGPLFVFAPEGTAAEPPSVLEALPFFNVDTGQEMPGPLTRIELVPPGRHLLRLEIKGGEGSWVDIPDPGPQLGSSRGLWDINTPWLKSLPVIKIWEDPATLPDDRPPWHSRNVKMTGRGDHANGFEVFSLDSDLGIWNEDTGQYERITDQKPYFDLTTLSKTTHEMTIAWDQIVKANLYLEWYSLTGTALAARGDKIACQGVHTFYGHIPIAGERKWVDYGTPIYESIVYQRPCVLEYDLKTEKWTPLVDLMTVPESKMSDPILVNSMPWKADYLDVDSKGKVYLNGTRRQTTQLMRYEDEDSHDALGQVPGQRPRVIVYRDQPYYLAEREPYPGSSEPRKVLQGFNGKTLDPHAQLGGKVAPVSAKFHQAGAETEVQLKPGEEISAGLIGDLYDITAWGDQLVAMGYLRRDLQDLDMAKLSDYNPGSKPNAIIEGGQLATMLRYDGERWQVWPGGADDLLKSRPRTTNANEQSVPSSTGKTIKLHLRNLAFANYLDGYPDLSRYSVIAAGKDQPPPLKGF